MSESLDNGRRAAVPPSGDALAARLDAIRGATLGRVRRRERAGLVARLAIGGGGVAAVVLAAVMFVTTSGLPRGAAPAPYAGTTAPQVDAPTVPETTALCAGGDCYGMSGATAWYLDGATLATTIDGGGSWQTHSLPAQLRSGFQQAAVDAKGDVIVAARSSTMPITEVVVGVLKSGTTKWATSSYTPDEPSAGTTFSGMPTSHYLTALVALSPDGTHAVLVAQTPVLDNKSDHAVLVSSDGGRTFTQRSSGTSEPWLQVTVGDSGDAYSVTNADAFQVQASEDDGKTWVDTGRIDFNSQSTIAGSPVLAGAPGKDGQLVATSRNLNGRPETVIYIATADTVMAPAGQFKAASGETIPAVAPIGDRYAAITADTLWTTDSDGAWHSRKLTGLPSGWTATELGFSSKKDGLAVLSKGTAFAVYATTDGGMSWAEAASASQGDAPLTPKPLPSSSVTDPASIAATVFSKTLLPGGGK